MHAHTQSNPDQLIELSAVCRELVAIGIEPPKAGVRWLQVAAASAKFPAEKRNSKWYIYRRHLPHVAESYAAKPLAEGAP